MTDKHVSTALLSARGYKPSTVNLCANDSVLGASVRNSCADLSVKSAHHFENLDDSNNLNVVPTPGASNKLSTFVTIVTALGANVHAFSANSSAFSADDPVFSVKLTFAFPVLDADFSVYTAHGGNLTALNTLPASASTTSMCKPRVLHLNSPGFLSSKCVALLWLPTVSKNQWSANTSTTA